MDSLCSMTPNSDGFEGKVFTGKSGIRAAGYAIFFSLVSGKVTGQCSMLSSTWVEGLTSCRRTQRYV